MATDTGQGQSVFPELEELPAVIGEKPAELYQEDVMGTDIIASTLIDQEDDLFAAFTALETKFDLNE